MSSPIIKKWLKENTQGAKDTVINFAKSTLKPLTIITKSDSANLGGTEKIS